MGEAVCHRPLRPRHCPRPRRGALGAPGGSQGWQWGCLLLSVATAAPEGTGPAGCGRKPQCPLRVGMVFPACPSGIPWKLFPAWTCERRPGCQLAIAWSRLRTASSGTPTASSVPREEGPGARASGRRGPSAFQEVARRRRLLLLQWPDFTSVPGILPAGRRLCTRCFLAPVPGGGGFSRRGLDELWDGREGDCPGSRRAMGRPARHLALWSLPPPLTLSTVVTGPSGGKLGWGRPAAGAPRATGRPRPPAPALAPWIGCPGAPLASWQRTGTLRHVSGPAGSCTVSPRRLKLPALDPTPPHASLGLQPGSLGPCPLLAPLLPSPWRTRGPQPPWPPLGPPKVPSPPASACPACQSPSVVVPPPGAPSPAANTVLSNWGQCSPWAHQGLRSQSPRGLRGAELICAP